ncbi:reductive dehalogenase [Thermodesulfobacteriota bacterium]
MNINYKPNRRSYKGRIYPDPYPVEKLKRVDRPTTKINDDQVQRVDEREAGFKRAGRGDFGPRIQKEYMRFVPKHPGSKASMWMMYKMIPFVDGNIKPTKAPIPDDPVGLSLHIKEYAYFLRADLVGICKLPPYAVYTHNFEGDMPVELNHKYAIAILIDQNWNTNEAFNGHDWISNSMSMMSYSTSGFIAIVLAHYIRSLGYPARAHYAADYQVVLPPILLWAGLGEMSRIGDIVVNPFMGPRFKAAIVTTNLPLVPDKPIDFGLQDFCNKCKKCARECPSKAISDEDKVMHNGYEKWPLDVQKCTSMRVGNQQGSGCGTCMKSCPWNKPYTPFHRTVMWSMRHFPFLRRFAILGDDLFGYGTPKYKNKWWFDLEDVEGEFIIPSDKDRKLYDN